jgi:uncharacterized protein (DUF1330 family)
MTAYLLVDTKIHDVDEYEKYKLLAKPIAEKFGGKYLSRGADLDVIEDDLWSPSRLVLLEFPDTQSARAFIDSEEYAPAKALRHAHADCTLVLFDGV